MQRSTEYLAVRESVKGREQEKRKGERRKRRGGVIGICVQLCSDEGFFFPQLSNKISNNKNNQSWKIEDIIILRSREKVVKINNVRVFRQKRCSSSLLPLQKAAAWFCFNYLSSGSRVHDEKVACVCVTCRTKNTIRLVLLTNPNPASIQYHI